MLITQAIPTILNSSLDLVNLVGGRFYADNAPQPQQGQPFPLPCVVIQADDAQSIITMRGPSRMTNQMVTFGCLSLKDQEATAIAALVYSLIYPSGQPLRGLFNGVRIKAVFFEGEQSGREPVPGAGQDVQAFTKDLRFKFWFLSNNIAPT